MDMTSEFLSEHEANEQIESETEFGTYVCDNNEYGPCGEEDGQAKEGEKHSVTQCHDDDQIDGEDKLGEDEDIIDGEGLENSEESDSYVSHGDEDEGGDDNMEENYSSVSEGEDRDDTVDDAIVIDSLVDILKLDLKNICTDVVGRFDFANLEVAFLFYEWYAKINGFSVRRGQIIKSKKGELLQQTFLCSRQGFREQRGLTDETRQRRPRHESRCGCEARFRVHVNCHTHRWYVTVFIFHHNHDMLGGNQCMLLPAHRKLSTADIMQIENFRISGVKPTQMYGTLANAAGGYHRLGYIKKDIYNQIGKQRRQRASDACGAVTYLLTLKMKDPLMYVKHTVDEETRLQHIFWCDGESRMSYEVFGDVLAFDATYRKNRYKCPFVVFSGVNHHNQTIVFATALVSNEKEETYVWLLKQFMIAMKQKAPKSVITDGDKAMKNAIKRVLPNSHHRLCAWHLIRNAVSNVHISEFLPYMKRCMLGDFEVEKFEQLWAEMVTQFELEDNQWINEMYEKRINWAIAHIRGNFFAGLRTTSRCEAFHSHIGQFVHPRISLTDFVMQFQRCLTYFRFREVEADFQSEYGLAVLQTNLHSLERSASNVYTKEIFFLFRLVLSKALLYQVIECQEMSMCNIYSVSKYRGQGAVWQVSYCPSPIEFRCCCLRMESLGIPCEHILAVVVRLDFLEIPRCLVLNRWSKSAKDSIRGLHVDGCHYWDSELVARFATVSHLSKVVSEMSYHDIHDYNHYVELLASEYKRLQLKQNTENVTDNAESLPIMAANVADNLASQTSLQNLKNPVTIRSKGCGPSTNTSIRRRRLPSCGACGGGGHNRRSCPIVRQSQEFSARTSFDTYTERNNYVDDDVEEFSTQFLNEHLVKSSRSYVYGS